MKNKKLKSESHGTQQQTWAGGAGAGSNFQHGKDLGTHTRGSLGTRGGDSNFSRRTQRIMPIDYFDARHAAESDKDCDGEDWATGYCPDEELDEDYVVENSRYKLSNLPLLAEQRVGLLDAEPEESELNRTVDKILSDPTELSKFERSMGENLYEYGSELILRDALSFTGAGDEIMGALRIFINIFIQIRRSNNEMDSQEEVVEKYLEYLGQNSYEINSSEERKNKESIIIQEHIRKLQSIQDDIARDLADTLQGVIALWPDDVAGPMAALETILGKLAERLPEVLSSIEIENLSELEMIVKKDPEFEGLRYAIALLSGLKALSNFSMVLGGPLGLASTALSLLNINIFNPSKILISGIRSYFVGEMLQNRLLVADQIIAAGRTEFFDRPEGEEYSETSMSPEKELDDTSSIEPQGSEFFRKLFFKDQGDQGMFGESLDNQSLLYLIEDIDSELDEDIDSELDEDDMNEFSGAGGAGGVSLPLGMSTKGPKGNTSANSGGAAWPYSKKQQAAFKKYSKKSFGGK